MHPKALVDLAAALVEELLRLDAPADGIVSAHLRRTRSLGPRERHALAETAYAVLRRRLLWQHLAQGGRGPLARRLVLLAWQGEPRALAAATDAAERDWLARVGNVDPASLAPALQHNLPDWIAAPLQARLGPQEFAALAAALLEPAPLDLRVNALRTTREAVQQELAQAGIEARPTPWSPWGLRVQGKPALHKLPVFERGDVEVQDEGSQLLALAPGARRGEMVVDFCAGAGGKTLALGAAMRSSGRLYAFDVAAHRLDALRPRLARSGLSNVHPVCIAHERDERVRRLAGKIDRVLVDAPCSGLGTLRRNPDLKWRQTPQAVAEMAGRQASILAAAATLPKPGGRLVYATCSLLAEENEAIAEAFTRAHPDFAPLAAADLLAPSVPGVAALAAPEGPWLRLWPHRHACDGFFAAAWQRR